MLFTVSCGCQPATKKTKTDTNLFGATDFGKGQYTSDQITGISISHTHMTLHSMKSFELREVQGETVFSCHFFEDEGEIKIEEVRVPTEYMQKLREIAKKYDFASLKEKKPSNIFIHDAPMYRMTLYWPDNKRLSLNYWPANGSEELEIFFREMAQKYN
jgi:hypothetical protein